jgi:hypothetical protein
MSTQRKSYRFTSGGSHPKAFSLFWSTARNRPAVRCIDENWDYEDCEWAAELSAEVRECRSLSDAAEYLGLQCDASDTAPGFHPSMPC